MDTHDHSHPGLQFRVLADADIERIYQATLACLERTGVEIRNREGRTLLAAAGATVDGQRVRIPPQIIRDALASAPGRFPIWGRDPERSIEVAPGAVHFGPGPSCTYYMDPETGERRRALRGDPGLTARVCDALQNMDYVMGLALPDDVPASTAPVHEFAAMVANTGKPLLAWAFSLDNLRDIYAIAAAAAGGEGALQERPFLAYFATSQAPLIHTDEELANAFWCAEHGIPVVYLGSGTAGLSSPITGAATLVTSLALELSGLAMIQLKRPGAPVCVGGVPSPMDPSTVRPLYGAPEMSLYSAALAECAAYLGLPFMGTAGATEAKTLDQQAAIESTVQVLFSLLSGTALPHDAGFLDCADIGSLEMLVMNDEIISMARRLTRGIEVSDDTLMLDLIDQIGPGGDFLATVETAKRFRHEIWMPALMERSPWEQWSKRGNPTMERRLRERVHKILATHRPPPLPEGAAERIQGILEAAEARASRP